MKIIFESAEEKAKVLEEVSNVSGASCKQLYLEALTAGEVVTSDVETDVSEDGEDGEGEKPKKRGKK